MIVPFGNPQNLYLYSYYGLDLGDFLAAMALPFALSTAGIVACTWWLCGQSHGSCGRDDTRSLAVPMPLSRRRLAIYGALVALTLLAVFRIVPVAAAVAVVAAALAALDRRALAAVDWGLLATFACFFVFAGNLARVPEVSAWLSPLMADHGLLVSAGLSRSSATCPPLCCSPTSRRMAAPARRREHRRRRHPCWLTCEPHHAAALHQRAQNLPPSDRVARAIHWSLPRPVQRAELWFPGHSLDCLRDGVFLLEKSFDFERFF